MQYPCKFADCAPPGVTACFTSVQREVTDDCCVVAGTLFRFSQKLGKGIKIFLEIGKCNGQGFDI